MRTPVDGSSLITTWSPTGGRPASWPKPKSMFGGSLNTTRTSVCVAVSFLPVRT